MNLKPLAKIPDLKYLRVYWPEMTRELRDGLAALPRLQALDLSPMLVDENDRAVPAASLKNTAIEYGDRRRSR